MNIACSLREIAGQQGAKDGLLEVKTSKKLTFSELEQRSDDYAWYLTLKGVKQGDRVMLMVKPSADFICLTFALFKIGAPVILIDPGMGYKNLLRSISGVKPVVFIGIPKAHLFLKIFKKHFRSIKLKFCCGPSFGVFGKNVQRAKVYTDEKFHIYSPEAKDLAAIIFTTGSTGPPKGVRYEHSVFSAQLQLIKEYYQIGNKDIDQPAFPLFALFSTAIGACAVIPDMDATKPARVDPKKFVESIIENSVTYSFGSPALWNVVSKYCVQKVIILNSIKKILMAGAPVSGELLTRMKKILPPETQIHTPYGATESLPIVSIESTEIINDTWKHTREGRGTCVGRPLPGIEIEVIKISPREISQLEDSMVLERNEIGEIIVSGNVVTQAYDNNEYETRMAKIFSERKFWHRMGDAGYIDDFGRLWFCGRKAHMVKTQRGDMFTIQCEAIVNNHSDVFRSALVGCNDKDGFQKPVMIIETNKECKLSKEVLLSEVKDLTSKSDLTKDIDIFLFHHDFPVDIRHNAKIFREKLQIWAHEQLS